MTYTITDLANEFGITHRALRFYEEKGLIEPERKGQTRIYSNRDRVRLRLIIGGRDVGLTASELPLVLPPAVAGIGLLAAFGRLGLLGGQLDALGVTIGFTQAAVVLAILFVAGPFYVRQAIASFEAVDADLLLAGRTLGAGPARAFWRIALPLASGGLGAGAALSLARGIGEFGATIMFAGSLQGVTETVTLARSPIHI